MLIAPQDSGFHRALTAILIPARGYRNLSGTINITRVLFKEQRASLLSSLMADAILESLSASNIFDLRGVVAVVTGAGTEIGMMISCTLIANGATVYIIGPVQADLDKVCATYNAACENASTRGQMHGI
ncbi:hypothetical protein C8R45DRAFT_1026954 [Mycena sanguinolenta]|nr:hypothetical protein C8R45DRAFT_1026954 [Mycena sanguinolenta]